MERLIKITVILTELCNLRCKYCYVKERPTTTTSEVLVATIAFARSYLEQGHSVMLDLFGGEPLVAESLTKEAILLARVLDMDFPGKLRCIIYTNATLLTEDFLSFTKNYPFVDYNFSIDGCEVSHNSARVFKDGRGSYEAVKAGIKRFESVYKMPHGVYGKWVISPDNVKYLAMDVRREFDSGRRVFSHSLAKEANWTDKDLKVYKDVLRDMGDLYIEQIDTGLFLDLLLFPIMDFKIRQQHHCGASTMAQFSIAPNGDIYPCQRFFNNRSNFVLGNVSRGLDVNSRGYKRIAALNKIDHSLACKTCDVFENYNCNGQCLGAMHEAQDVFTCIPIVCELLKATYKEAERVHSVIGQHPQYQRRMDVSLYGY